MMWIIKCLMLFFYVLKMQKHIIRVSLMFSLKFSMLMNLHIFFSASALCRANSRVSMMRWCEVMFKRWKCFMLRVQMRSYGAWWVVKKMVIKGAEKKSPKTAAGVWLASRRVRLRNVLIRKRQTCHKEKLQSWNIN